MISILWTFLIVIGILFSLLSGRVDVINESIIESGKDALVLIYSLMPMIILFSGVMNIADKSGLLDKFARFLNPILAKLFPSIEKESKALNYIASNIAANMLGLGSVATPFGLKAMEELQKVNKKKDTASDAMITFLVLNTGGVTIIPTTIIALRMSYNSLSPTRVIVPCIIATFSSCISAVIIDYFIRRRHE